ncbi:MAG: GNAT family N-acetyltransferase [Flavobacteriaceae bacterium]|nr:GNAT family N-acetyltransferase [Flavobacteriaceae bacterium]
MVIYTSTSKNADIQQILNLQQKNLPQQLSQEAIITHGFVTVEHDLKLLKLMSTTYPHVIAKHDDKIVGYALVMLPHFADHIEILKPMFHQFKKVVYQNKKITKQRYFVMGQICIDKPFRGKGLFKGLYDRMKKQMQKDFDFVVTEVDKLNTRSLKAHYTIGFKNINEYKSPDGKQWVILLWDWR